MWFTDRPLALSASINFLFENCKQSPKKQTLVIHCNEVYYFRTETIK